MSTTKCEASVLINIRPGGTSSENRRACVRTGLWFLTRFTAVAAISSAGAVSVPSGDRLTGERLTQGPGGPILVIAAAANPLTRYYAEILRNEGFNSFAVADISSITPGVLRQYDVAILGEMALSAGQAAMLTNWVGAGGNLIAMRPDKKLAPLLGLRNATGPLDILGGGGYLLVNNVPGPGSGIVHQTIQFHGVADLYTPASGTSTVARLFSTATAVLPNPAVTVRKVGAGSASAFLYDLARSVVYTRQGNPAWAGQSRDGQRTNGKFVIRPDNLFYGASARDPQPDWNNLDNVSVPIADEQQRLLGNLILWVNRNKKPLPRFWYFPYGLKAVVIMTGDDHSKDDQRQAPSKLEALKAASFAGCSVSKWECVRSTSYIYTGGVTAAEARQYSADGFEIALHVNTNCENFTPASLADFYSTQLLAFQTRYPDLPAPSTVRTHCMVWSDYDTQPKVEFHRGIRLDTNYYYWPGKWAQRSGMFTGSGMPMRFAAADGTMIDVYQVATQIPDESHQEEPYAINRLLDQALGPAGYYGAFTANMHTDWGQYVEAYKVVAAAQAHGVPVISARQMLQWVDARNASSFGALRWDGRALTFTIHSPSEAAGIQAMLPLLSRVGALSGITRNGSSVAYTTQTIKGFQYALFPALAGSYTASYDADAPIILTVSPARASLWASQGDEFTLLRNGAPVRNVTWTISPPIGSVSAAGIYTAPAAIPANRPVTLTAGRAADGAQIAEATIILMKKEDRKPAAGLASQLLNVIAWEIQKLHRWL
jgi:hypothetical protein